MRKIQLLFSLIKWTVKVKMLWFNGWSGAKLGLTVTPLSFPIGMGYDFQGI
jgi:hypothetical protein